MAGDDVDHLAFVGRRRLAAQEVHVEDAEQLTVGVDGYAVVRAVSALGVPVPARRPPIGLHVVDEERAPALRDGVRQALAEAQEWRDALGGGAGHGDAAVSSRRPIEQADDAQQIGAERRDGGGDLAQDRFEVEAALDGAREVRDLAQMGGPNRQVLPSLAARVGSDEPAQA
jgi:hypothetical protein